MDLILSNWDGKAQGDHRYNTALSQIMLITNSGLEPLD